MNIDDLELLHNRIENSCLSLFSDGHYKNAASQAMIEVELAIKEKSGIFDKYGSKLINYLFGKGDGLKLKVPFGERLQNQAMEFFKGSFSYYRNYLAHDGSKANKKQCFRILILASELLELIDASSISFLSIKGAKGLVEAGAFPTEEDFYKLLRLIDGYWICFDDYSGLLEDLARNGFSYDQVEILLEMDLINIQSREIKLPEEQQWSSETETIDFFFSTALGKKILKDNSL